MADSPALQVPIDPKEQPILDNLLVIRDKLLLLKADRSKYVKSEDVVHHYDLVLEQIAALNEIRQTKRQEQNRLDTVLDDCLQLISLFFLTIGRNAEAPAAYSVVSTIKRLLDHLKEAGYFSGKDLIGLGEQLEKIQASVERGKEHHDPQILTLLQNRVAACRSVLELLMGTMISLPVEDTPLHEKLISIMRTLCGLTLKTKFPINEVKEYQRQLSEIATHLDGHPEVLPQTNLTAEEQYEERLKKINERDPAAHPPCGRQIVVDLLGRCLLWSEIMIHKNGKFSGRLTDTFDHILGIYRQLEKLSLTQAWSLRETDLYGYQRALDRVDESRVNGNFMTPDGQPADLFEQRALLYLLRKSYATIYFMLTSSEPVSEALLPIYNQLTTLRRCLVEVKKCGGVGSPRELYPYSMKLNSIDNMRQDGKFIVNGEVPEGQGSVHALLSECFELAYELRNDAEQEQDDEDASSDEDEDSSRRHHDHHGGDDDLDADADDNVYGSSLKRAVGGVAGMSIGVK